MGVEAASRLGCEAVGLRYMAPSGAHLLAVEHRLGRVPLVSITGVHAQQQTRRSLCERRLLRVRRQRVRALEGGLQVAKFGVCCDGHLRRLWRGVGTLELGHASRRELMCLLHVRIVAAEGGIRHHISFDRILTELDARVAAVGCIVSGVCYLGFCARSC